MTTERPTPTGPEACNLAQLLAEQVALAVDPLRSLATIAGMVRRATAGSAVLTAASGQLAERGGYASFLAPLPDVEDAQGGETHVRITVLATPSDLRIFAAAVVLVSPAGDLQGLNRRELQVLGLLLTGAPNERIAAALGITARTVAAHVENLCAKLAAPSRTTAAAREVRLGLFVPPSLLADRRRRSASRRRRVERG